MPIEETYISSDTGFNPDNYGTNPVGVGWELNPDVPYAITKEEAEKMNRRWRAMGYPYHLEEQATSPTEPVIIARHPGHDKLMLRTFDKWKNEHVPYWMTIEGDDAISRFKRARAKQKFGNATGATVKSQTAVGNELALESIPAFATAGVGYLNPTLYSTIGRGVGKGVRAVGEAVLNPGSVADKLYPWISEQGAIIGANTPWGSLTNVGLTSLIGGDVARNIINGNLNWQTGIEAGLTAVPISFEAARTGPGLYRQISNAAKQFVKGRREWPNEAEWAEIQRVLEDVHRTLQGNWARALEELAIPHETRPYIGTLVLLEAEPLEVRSTPVSTQLEASRSIPTTSQSVAPEVTTRRFLPAVETPAVETSTGRILDDRYIIPLTEKPTLEEMRLFISDELSKAGVYPDAYNADELYNAINEFNKSYSLESAEKISGILGDDRYADYLMDKLREAVLAGDKNALDLYRKSTYYRDDFGISGNQLKQVLQNRESGAWSPEDEEQLKRRLLKGLGHFWEFDNPDINKEAREIVKILRETPGSKVFEGSLSTNSAPLYYNYVIRNLRDGSIKNLDLIRVKKLNTCGKPYYIKHRPSGKIELTKHPNNRIASNLDIIDYLINPQIDEINRLSGNNFPHATLDVHGEIEIPYIRASFKRGGKLIKRRRKFNLK